MVLAFVAWALTVQNTRSFCLLTVLFFHIPTSSLAHLPFLTPPLISISADSLLVGGSELFPPPESGSDRTHQTAPSTLWRRLKSCMWPYTHAHPLGKSHTQLLLSSAFLNTYFALTFPSHHLNPLIPIVSLSLAYYGFCTPAFLPLISMPRSDLKTTTEITI